MSIIGPVSSSKRANFTINSTNCYQQLIPLRIAFISCFELLRRVFRIKEEFTKKKNSKHVEFFFSSNSVSFNMDLNTIFNFVYLFSLKSKEICRRISFRDFK